MSIFNGSNPLLATITAAGGAAGYEIERSLRFNSADSAYLNRTPASAGNRKTWTWAGWVKRAKLGSAQVLFSAGNVSSEPNFDVDFGSGGGDSLRIRMTNVSAVQLFQLKTTQVFRDCSAWYHIIVSVDTAQSVASDRVKVYVNGSQVSSFSTETYPTQNLETWINATTYGHAIGRLGEYSGLYLDAYLADIHFIDGQALDPTSFGEFDDNGIWQPIAYTGSYGTNGFHLDFADNSTAAALGTDTSGNGNDWTVNNMSIITGTGRYLDTSFTNENPTYPTSLAFNGDLSSYNGAIANLTDGTFSVYTFSTPIPYTSQVRMYVLFDMRSTPPQVKANSTTFTGTGGGITTQWYTPLTGSGTLTSVAMNQYGGYVSAILAIEVDGTILVDASFNNTDSFVDVPTNGTETDTGVGGEVRGNYATWNPLSTTQTLSNGNLDVVTSTNGNVFTTVGISSGKYYCEYTINSASSSYGPRWGFSNANLSVYAALRAAATRYAGAGVTSITLNNHTSSITSGVIGINLDLDSYECKIYHNNNLKLTATGIPPGVYHFWVQGDASTDSVSLNAGQRPFAYTAPSGFKALCTANLDAPLVTKPSEYMDIALYQGNGTSQTISGLEFSPDFVWIKSRTNTPAARNHALFDTIRGPENILVSNQTNAERTALENGSLTSFDTAGFSLGADSIYLYVNDNNQFYVGWAWDAGDSTVSNTDGSITSSVRANPSAGFSIVTYTGNGSAGATVGHGLNVAPSFYVCKFRNTNAANGPWYVYHKSLGATKALTLDTTNAESTLSSVWNNTEPSSTVFSLGNAGDTNGSGRNFVSYCFAPVDGYSSFGSYTGNGSADGPFVYTGHRSRWLLIKDTTNSGNWRIYDTARDTYNVAGAKLYPNSSVAENSVSGETASTNTIDFLSNGFKLRTSNSETNFSGDTYIWASFAENPFQYARAR